MLEINAARPWSQSSYNEQVDPWTQRTHFKQFHPTVEAVYAGRGFHKNISDKERNSR